MAAPQIPYISVEDYLEIDKSPDCKYEYYRGHLIGMAGGSFIHGLIIVNVAGELRALLKGSVCRVVSNDVRLAADPDAHYTYPDVMVVCGDPAFQQGRPQTVTNPILVVEVLSSSTEASDRGRKFTDCRRLPSLREYMMVSQTEPRVEVFRPNQDGHWTLFESVGQGSAVKLDSVGVELSMAEIYRGVKFEPEPPVAE